MPQGLERGKRLCEKVFPYREHLSGDQEQDVMKSCESQRGRFVAVKQTEVHLLGKLKSSPASKALRTQLETARGKWRSALARLREAAAENKALKVQNRELRREQARISQLLEAAQKEIEVTSRRHQEIFEAHSVWAESELERLESEAAQLKQQNVELAARIVGMRRSENLQNPLLMRVEDLELPSRAARCLRSANIGFVGDLIQKTDDELMQIEHFGRKCLNDVLLELGRHGLTLGQKIAHWPTIIAEAAEPEEADEPVVHSVAEPVPGPPRKAKKAPVVPPRQPVVPKAKLPKHLPGEIILGLVGLGSLSPTRPSARLFGWRLGHGPGDTFHEDDIKPLVAAGMLEHAGVRGGQPKLIVSKAGAAFLASGERFLPGQHVAAPARAGAILTPQAETKVVASVPVSLPENGKPSLRKKHWHKKEGNTPGLKLRNRRRARRENRDQ